MVTRERHVAYALATLAIVTMLLLASVVYGAGIEMNYVRVSVSSKYLGSYMIFLVPLNVTDPSLLTFMNTYVVSQSDQSPRLSYLFSNYPPLVVFLEASVGPYSYGVYYGGTNPFTNYIAMPGGANSLFFLYDEFDYATGFWVGNYSVSASKATVYGLFYLNASYPQKYAFLTNILGGRAWAIRLPVSSGWVSTSLNQSTFTDWGAIIDGSDIYFLDPLGNPTNYSIIYLDKTAMVLIFSVYLNGFDTVYMVYGGPNPYASYRQ
jgi:hypothetical protein